MGIRWGDIVWGLMQGGATTMDQTHSGNGSNLRSLRRMELVYKDIDIKFAVNPSDYTQKEPNRVNITQTKGGAWIDAWGPGITEFNIRGITGVAGRKATATKDNDFTKIVNTLYDAAMMFSGDCGVDVGYQRWRELRDMFRKIYNDIKDGQTITDADLVRFYNWTDNEYWYCYPTASGIELYRSQSKPHVYQYTINLWGIRRIGEPATTIGVIGNPFYEEAVSAASEVDDSTTTNDNAEGGATAEGNESTTTTDSTTNETPDGESSNSGGNNADSNGSSSQTNSNSQQKTQGGTAYITKAAALDTQADVITITNTKTRNTAVIRAQAERHMLNLEPIVGGYNGVLVPTTAYFSAKDLQISQHGIALYINEFDQYNFLKTPELQEDLEELDSNRLLEEMHFSPTVSVETYKLWQSILECSPEVLTPDLIHPIGSTPKERIIQTIENSKYYGSTIFGFIAQYRPRYYITKTDIKYLEVVLLDSMMIYMQLYKISQSTGKITTPVTLANINVLIKNIQALIIYLEFNATDETIFYIQNIMWELRQLEAILHQVKTDIIDYL